MLLRRELEMVRVPILPYLKMALITEAVFLANWLMWKFPVMELTLLGSTVIL